VLGRGRVRWGAGGKFIEWDSRAVHVRNSAVAEEMLQKYRYIKRVISLPADVVAANIQQT